MNFIYSKIWNQLNAGLPDHWFYSNYDNMRIVMNLYDNLIEYLKPDSEYRFSVCNNWPFSNYENEFSNEILKDEPLRSNNMRNPCYDSILNNHYIYKWHFYKNNILEKTKYVGKYF
jgi:hypothetical protein